MNGALDVNSQQCIVCQITLQKKEKKHDNTKINLLLK